MAFLADAKRKGIDLTAKDEDGYTPVQHFFLAFGQDWCGGFRPQLTRLLVQTDPHSPDPIPRQWSGAEYAGVRRGVRLQGGPAHDAGERVPRLVNCDTTMGAPGPDFRTWDVHVVAQPH